eukprot:scaffold9059_cov108-Isochrysis_galbana.AAC.4
MAWSMEGFDDECVSALLELLRQHHGIFSVNLGEKPNVTCRGWRSLRTGLSESNVIAMFIDFKNIKCAFGGTDKIAGHFIRLVKNDLKQRRLRAQDSAQAHLRLAAACAAGDATGRKRHTPARRLISRPGAPGTCSRTSVRLGKAKTCGGLSRFGVGAPRRRATGGP